MTKEMWIPLVAGGTAGTVVDVVLFPLDTIKTRLQSSKGFLKSGGFSGIYRGILSAALGSFPGGAVFFCGYEISKSTLHPIISNPTLVYMASATIGEMGFRGLYRGYFKTVMREIPFSFIQFPIWEYLKKQLLNKDGTINAFQSGLAGAVSGAIAGGITTPLDVVKTRVMLAEKEAEAANSGILQLALKIGKDEGVKKLFSGVVPRVVWLGLGGFVFLGAYDSCRHLLLQLNSN